MTQPPFCGVAWGLAMAGIVGLLSMVLGACVACVADRFPAHVEAMETGAGFLLLSGLTLAGLALPAML